MTAHCVSIASGAQSHPRRFACLLAPELNSPFLHNARSFPARYDASTQRPARSTAVAPVAFKFMKKLGLQKPAFLPDFGLVTTLGSLNQTEVVFLFPAKRSLPWLA